MTEGPKWREIVALPIGDNYGSLTVESLVRACLAFGYDPAEVDVDRMWSMENERYIRLSVGPDTEGYPPLLSIRTVDDDPIVPTVAPVAPPRADPEPAPPAPPAEATVTDAPEADDEPPAHGAALLAARAAFTGETGAPFPYWKRREPMLLCDECQWFTNTTVTMQLHTGSAHGREPSTGERTPLLDEEALEVHQAWRAAQASTRALGSDPVT